MWPHQVGLVMAVRAFLTFSKFLLSHQMTLWHFFCYFVIFHMILSDHPVIWQITRTHIWTYQRTHTFTTLMIMTRKEMWEEPEVWKWKSRPSTFWFWGCFYHSLRNSLVALPQGLFIFIHMFAYQGIRTQYRHLETSWVWANRCYTTDTI